MSNCIPLSFVGGGLGGGELLLVFVVILLFFGSKKLPGIAHAMGKALEEFRRAARDVTGEIMRAREEPPADQELPSTGEPESKESTNERAG